MKSGDIFKSIHELTAIATSQSKWNDVSYIYRNVPVPHVLWSNSLSISHITHPVSLIQTHTNLYPDMWTVCPLDGSGLLHKTVSMVLVAFIKRLTSGTHSGVETKSMCYCMAQGV